MVTEQITITRSQGMTAESSHIYRGDGGTDDGQSIVLVDIKTRQVKQYLTAAAHPGVRELRWIHENQDAIASYRGMWIAIRGEEVVASQSTFEEVHDRVLQMGLADALIVQVPDDMTEWDHLLA